jgi:hypothetical protein
LISWRTLQFRYANEAPRPSEQDDLLRRFLVDLIDLRHELMTLTVLID